MVSRLANSDGGTESNRFRTGIDDGVTLLFRRRPRRQRQRYRPCATAALHDKQRDPFTIALGGGSGVVLPRLVLGTMQFGEALDRKTSHGILDAALDEAAAAAAAAGSKNQNGGGGGGGCGGGLLAVDTAEAYPVPMSSRTSGASEEIIGEWLRADKKARRRQRTAIVTKVSGPGDQEWIRGGPPRLDGRSLTEALEGSLGRLGVDEIDLLLLHWPDRYVPMFGDVEFDPSRSFFPTGGDMKGAGDDEKENDDDDGLAETERHFEDVLGAAADAIAAGKLRAVGLSNETPLGLLAAASVTRRRRKDEREKWRREGGEKPLPFPGVAAVSNAYSLLARNFDSGGLAEACAATRVPLLGYGPLAAGLLTGKYDDGDEEREEGRDGVVVGSGGRGGRSGDGGGPPEARLNRYRHEYSEEGKRYARTPKVQEAVRSYVRIAQRAGLEGGGAELALRFALWPRGGIGGESDSSNSSDDNNSNSAVVFGATSVEHVRAAHRAAAKGPLPREVLEACDAVHKSNPNPAP